MDRKPLLVSNWRDAWRWWSVRIAAVLASLGPIWLTLPEELKQSIPVEWLPYVAPILILSIVFARVIDQRLPE